ncbi:MAG: class I SAM-dependent methyltransferase [Lachnospiraceae bacterium]|nr:class I SAM-dependent methyltransferase [Lachnospiraceae bacterium]
MQQRLPSTSTLYKLLKTNKRSIYIVTTEHTFVNYEVEKSHRTLFIPLYGKARVSRKNIILSDPIAEKIWEKEAFPVKGKSGSKWLAYNMAMRARIFDEWTDSMIEQDPGALVLHIGCGLDSRCQRVKNHPKLWLDCDFPDVISMRRRYYEETSTYQMHELNASDPEQVRALPDSNNVIVILEGISMYLTNEQLRAFLAVLQEKYKSVHILMDIYTVFGAKASKYKNPINDVGVTTVYGIDDINGLLKGLQIRFKAEHSLTPPELVDELQGFDKRFFKLMFTGKMYKKIYRLVELERTMFR